MQSKKILQNLIPFKTVSGTNPDEFKKCLNYIDSIVQNIPDWSYREYNSKGFISRVYSHKNFIKSDIKEFDIYLYGNIDVVDGGDSLFVMQERDGKLFGRGTIDMKFGVAVSLEVLLKLSQEILKKPIALVITTDEELGGINGAKYLVDELGYRGKCVIGPNGMLDEHSFNFEISNKGTIHTKYSAAGNPSHGSRPWDGDNPIERLIHMYIELEQEFNKGSKDIWDSTINLGMLHGGFATNAVPEKAFMNIDFRYIDTEQAKKYYEFENTLLNKYKAKKELIVDATNINVDVSNPLVEMYLDIAAKFVKKDSIKMVRSYGSHDVREFFKVGMVPIIFTPRGSDNHTNNEWILEKDLEVLVDIDVEFIKRFYN